MNKFTATLSFFVVTGFTLLLSSSALSFGKPAHSKVEASSSLQKDGSLKFQFKVVADENMMITYDAPWQLTVKEHPGLKLTKEKFVVADLDKKLPGYEISVTPDKDLMTGNITYQLIAFVCTKDKTRCYREVHDSTFAWKK